MHFSIDNFPLLSFLFILLPAVLAAPLRPRQYSPLLSILSTCTCIPSGPPLTPPAFTHFITNVWTPHGSSLSIAPGSSITLGDASKQNGVKFAVFNADVEPVEWSMADVGFLLSGVEAIWREGDQECMPRALGIRCGAAEGVRGIAMEVRGG